MKQQADTLRMAAILIDSLDKRSADILLERMGSEQAERVRSAVLQLDHVAPEERRRVIEALTQAGKTSSVPSPVSADEAGVEMDESLVRKINAAMEGGESEPDDTDESDALASEIPPQHPSPLDNVPVESLVHCLSDEHPQTIGALLANLPTRKAAQVVRRLPAHLQSDVLQRLANLDGLHESVLEELEQQLLAKLEQADSQPLEHRGMTALKAILDAADAESRETLLANLEGGDGRLVCPSNSVADNESPDSENLPLPPSCSPVPAPPAFDFHELVAMDDANLARLLRAADPEVALLALTGASREFVDRILRRMRPRDSRALRHRMSQLGPIRLSDIEQAQRQLALLAQRMADEGLIELPSSRRLSAAA